MRRDEFGAALIEVQEIGCEQGERLISEFNSGRWMRDERERDRRPTAWANEKGP